MPSIKEQRLRNLTAKGTENYIEKKTQFLVELEKLWKLVSVNISKFDSQLISKRSVTEIKKVLLASYTEFTETAENYLHFLKRMRTVESDIDYSAYTKILSLKKRCVDNALIDNMMEAYFENTKSIKEASECSLKTKTSMSSHSSNAGRKRAKAEAAKVRVAFAEKEAQLMKQSAAIEAEMKVLKEKREAAALDEEAKVLEMSERSLMVLGLSHDENIETDQNDRTRQFLADQAYQNHRVIPEYEPVDMDSHKIVNDTPQELTKFLLKKDLLTSRLCRYDDRAGTYAVWKSGFLSVVRDLQVTPSEELDLLVKWLGTESSRYAVSIRSANASCPQRGLLRLWERLDECYGAPEIVEAELKKKILSFPRLTNKDNSKLYELTDILSEVEAMKEDPKYTTLLAYYDSSSGVTPIVNKLPSSIQQKWVGHASTFKKNQRVPFPPFSVFVDFMRDVSRVRNDPALQYEDTSYQSRNTRVSFGARGPGGMVMTRKTVSSEEIENRDLNTRTRCPIHRSNHPLSVCKVFEAKSIQGRRAFLRREGVCYRCINSTSHKARECTARVKCDICKSAYHLTIMHLPAPIQDGGEQNSGEIEAVTSKCTTLCKDSFNGRSCGKIVMVRVSHSNRSRLVYAILDEQSNRSLAKSKLLDDLGLNTEEIHYTLTSCSGTFQMTGRRAVGITVESLSGTASHELPVVFECNQIPDERSEIPTYEVAECFPHLNKIANDLQPLDPNIHIELLIGRDLPEAFYVHEQVTGPRNSPFAQRMSLGWVIIGDVCLGNIHKPSVVNVNKIQVLRDGRGTIFDLCKNNILLKENSAQENIEFIPSSVVDELGKDVFTRSKDDEKVSTSVEDREFITLMDSTFGKDDTGHWTAPLPFRSPRPVMKNNRPQAWTRAQALDSSLRRNPVKKEQFFTFMAKVLETGAAEEAPPPVNGNEYWYLPLFGVHHPKKPGSIRGVFDSSAKFEGMTLNSLLLQGPDLTNSLVGVIMRFRKDEFAISADIEQMFYQFRVDEDCRDFLRFFWYKDNDIENDLIEHRMCVHVFGNSPSPAVATYGLRKTAENAASDVQEFVQRNFYVDDGLSSKPDMNQAADLLRRTQHTLEEGKLRLHKVNSNCREILLKFPKEDLGKEIQNIDLKDSSQLLPLQGCLGLQWDLNKDCFVFNLGFDVKPFTRRGILSTLNGVFDPLGFLSPLTVAGKILLRELSPSGTDWDEPLSPLQEGEWERWKVSALSVNGMEIPRMVVPNSVSSASCVEVHIYCDASEKAIAAVAYLRTIDNSGNSKTGFVMGKSKLAPSSGHTIPRLELCSAVLAVELWDLVEEHLDVVPSSVCFYSDSKVALGYINNRSRRFYTYVSNRVQRIHRSSTPQQWKYVPTHLNPADAATRSSSSDISVKQKAWLEGHAILKEQDLNPAPHEFLLVLPDTEVRPCALKTDVRPFSSIEPERFERFSNWNRLVRSISLLKHLCKHFHSPRQDSKVCKDWHSCNLYRDVDLQKESETFIIKQVQRIVFGTEISLLLQGKPIHPASAIISLTPFVDDQGVLRVGGRTVKAKHILGTNVTNPIILPKGHHVSILIIRHYHEAVRHQGRHITEGALRSAGLWVIGAKRTITSLIRNCVTCRKLRRNTEHQKMADIPSDRLTPGPPFTSVGVDTFGPWSVITRRTRGGVSNSKRWAILFSCLTTRAVHLEVVEEMSSSSFINALRRFVSLRGPVKLFRSDRGTNFVGAIDDLKIDSVNVEDKLVNKFLYDSGVKWVFNAPHASHMGGVWERMIGVARRILDSIFLECKDKPLTHETLVTFMAEVTAIMNSRPIAQISNDPESPLVLSPSMLLTGKVDILPVMSDPSDLRDMYRAQWKRVQLLADTFWRIWKRDYLHSLQTRRKWLVDQPNLKVGNVVLLRENGTHRNEWPLGIVDQTFTSDDGHVRKVSLRVHKDGKTVTYVRPINELVLLTE